MTSYENQIVEMQKLIVLAEFDTGAYQEVGSLYFPKGYTHNYVKLYRYKGFNRFREGYDFACDSFVTLQDFVGLDLILYEAHRPTQRTNKAVLWQTLEDSRKQLRAGEYTRMKVAIEELPYYMFNTLEEGELE